MPTLAPSHRFSVAEYYRMAEAGIFPNDERVELLDGLIVDMLPVGPYHAGVGTRLHTLFSAAGENRWIVRSQYPVRLNDGSEPLPDLALVKPRPDYYSRDHPQPRDVILLIEVADSSVRFDREEKLPAYARAGVAEFWIVNLVERVVETYSEPQPAGIYGLSARVGSEGTVSPRAFPEVIFAVAEFLQAGA